jgi:hypothetical protein
VASSLTPHAPAVASRRDVDRNGVASSVSSSTSPSFSRVSRSALNRGSLAEPAGRNQCEDRSEGATDAGRIARRRARKADAADINGRARPSQVQVTSQAGPRPIPDQEVRPRQPGLPTVPRQEPSDPPFGVHQYATNRRRVTHKGMPWFGPSPLRSLALRPRLERALCSPRPTSSRSNT